MFGDQRMNMIKSVKRGYGVQVLYEEFSEDKFSEALNEVLSNPKYSETAKIVSSRFIDRPMTPQQSVVYWTEYAHRHQGAPHLRSSADELNILQLHSFDTMTVMLIIFAVILIADYFILKAIIKRCFRRRKIDSIKKTN